MKKTSQGKAVLRRPKRPLKDASETGFKTQQPLELRTSELSPEEITLPTPRRISPAADEEME